ncbi:MAG: GNAT family N-acetyltransferase [Planctomycetota bacterium]|nr:MAG: GNAT family N-acetyltransferase [Planctomycetota bacterium]
MSTKVAPFTKIHVRSGPYYLTDFDKLMAQTVASWVGSDLELLWLAPKTHPPLTAEKVLAWHLEQSNPLLFYRDGISEPLGYLELNPMPEQRKHLWMGHCIIRPDQRGVGLGRQLIEMMLEHAFVNRGARRVSLVVFPANIAAICCYRSTGFADAGEQVKYFSTSGKEHRMLRMTIGADRYGLLEHNKKST